MGTRRGRRHPSELRVGEALDFWRVEAVVPDRSLTLRAEMKLPGRGWLQFQVTPDAEPSSSLLVQTAYFAPKGLFGLVYWYSVYPLHVLIFSSMLEKLGGEAEAVASTQSPNPAAAVQ